MDKLIVSDKDGNKVGIADDYNAAGMAIEKMEADGWFLETKQRHIPNYLWEATFSKRGIYSKGKKAVADTFPEAVMLAAKAAKESG